jgi:hypothetical protein
MTRTHITIAKESIWKYRSSLRTVSFLLMKTQQTFYTYIKVDQIHAFYLIWVLFIAIFSSVTLINSWHVTRMEWLIYVNFLFNWARQPATSCEPAIKAVSSAQSSSTPRSPLTSGLFPFYPATNYSAAFPRNDCNYDWIAYKSNRSKAYENREVRRKQ